MSQSLLVCSDIHGELDRLASFLQTWGVIDSALHWRASDLVLVLNGDVVDRGYQIFPLLRSIERWQQEAVHFQSQVIYLAGNHEGFWLNKDFQYLPEFLLPTVVEQQGWWEPWFKTLPIAYQWQDIAVIHAGVDERWTFSQCLSHTLETFWCNNESSEFNGLCTRRIYAPNQVQQWLGDCQTVVTGHTAQFWLADALCPHEEQIVGPFAINQFTYMFVDVGWNFLHAQEHCEQ